MFHRIGRCFVYILFRGSAENPAGVEAADLRGGARTSRPVCAHRTVQGVRQAAAPEGWQEQPQVEDADGMSAGVGSNMVLVRTALFRVRPQGYPARCRSRVSPGVGRRRSIEYT
eukprot:1175568-Prorocentrum_minimum.AAC.1